MDRHFLITVSDQKSALNGVRFVGDFFSDKANIKSTLFYTAPKAPMLVDGEKSLAALNRQKQQERKLLETGKQALETAGAILVDKGFLKENLILKAQTQTVSKVSDIVHEGEKGAYDAVVMGRRAMGLLEHVYQESVSRALFKEKITFPLWLCNASEGPRKHILLYLDGSAASFKMADHVRFVLGENNTHRVDIMALESILSKTALMDRYVEALVGNGPDKSRIRTLPAVSGTPAKEILKAVENNGYAAVALGRASSEGNVLSRLFKGPVCSILFKELTQSCLWLCP